MINRSLAMPLEPRSTGGANTKFFESAEVVSQFDAIKTWLMKNFKKVNDNIQFN